MVSWTTINSRHGFDFLARSVFNRIVRASLLTEYKGMLKERGLGAIRACSGGRHRMLRFHRPKRRVGGCNPLRWDKSDSLRLVNSVERCFKTTPASESPLIDEGMHPKPPPIPNR